MPFFGGGDGLSLGGFLEGESGVFGGGGLSMFEV